MGVVETAPFGSQDVILDVILSRTVCLEAATTLDFCVLIYTMALGWLMPESLPV